MGATKVMNAADTAAITTAAQRSRGVSRRAAAAAEWKAHHATAATHPAPHARRSGET